MKTESVIPKHRRSAYERIKTISQLVALIEEPPADITPEERKLRERATPHLAQLKMLPPERTALYWQSALRTVQCFTELPSVKLIIGGGAPEWRKMPRYTKNLKAMREARGIHLHRRGKRAFLLAKPPVDAHPAP